MASQRGEHFEHIADEGLSVLSDDCNQKEEECLQDLPPLLYSSVGNTAACHPGEGIWDKFEFPNDAAREKKRITDLTHDKQKCEKDIKNDGDVEVWDKPTAESFPKGIDIKEDVMWSPTHSPEPILTHAQAECEPMEETSASDLCSSPCSLLLQPTVFPSASNVKAGQKCSLLNLNQQKCTVRTGSGSLPSPIVKKKEVPTAQCSMQSPKALHAATSDNGLLLLNSSNTVLTTPRKPQQKNRLLNTEKHHNIAKILSFSPPQKNLLQANSSNTVVATSPMKSGLKCRFLATKQQHLNRASSGSPLSTTVKKTQKAKSKVPSHRGLHAIVPSNRTFQDNCNATTSSGKPWLKFSLLNIEQQCHFVNNNILLLKQKVMTSEQVLDVKTVERKTRPMIKHVSITSSNLSPAATPPSVKQSVNKIPMLWHNIPSFSSDTQKLTNYGRKGKEDEKKEDGKKEGEDCKHQMVRNLTAILSKASSANSVPPEHNNNTNYDRCKKVLVNGLHMKTPQKWEEAVNVRLPIRSSALTQCQSKLKMSMADQYNHQSRVLEVQQLAADASTTSRKEQATAAANEDNSVECEHLSEASPVVECSKRKGEGVRRGKKGSKVGADEESDIYEKRFIRNYYQQQKRLEMNNLMEQLRTALPATEHYPRASTAMILQETVKYCREMPHKIKKQEKKLRKLHSRQKKLCQKLSLLRLEMAINRLAHELKTEFIRK